jgi:hypothetical protein
MCGCFVAELGNMHRGKADCACFDAAEYDMIFQDKRNWTTITNIDSILYNRFVFLPFLLLDIDNTALFCGLFLPGAACIAFDARLYKYFLRFRRTVLAAAIHHSMLCKLKEEVLWEN